MKDNEVKDLLAKERTLLAAERTYSAWIRTGIAGLAGGLAIIRFVVFKSETHKILAHIAGQMLIIWGTLLFIFAYTNYRKLTHKLRAHGMEIPLWNLFAITAVLLICAALLMWINLI